MSIRTRNVDVEFEFNYQSQQIRFNEWIELITLCLAPLIMHIIAGIPHPTYLEPSQPGWYKQISLYNPATIIWRYFSIFDRRIRAKSWNAYNMAASNTIFWTSKGWDGSEDMIKEGQAHCLRVPASTHVEFFSATAAKTLIITLQGLQAIYTLILGILSPYGNSYPSQMALHTLFVPMAILGLLRLLAAYWLTEDYHFAHVESQDICNINDQESAALNAPENTATPLLLKTLEQESLFRSVNSWRGICTRAIFMLLLLPIWGMSAYYFIPTYEASTFTASNFSISFFYLVFLTGTILIFLVLFCTGRSQTTILPYVNSIWYQAYTWMLFVFIVATITVSALETRKAPCGKYTTFSVYSDEFLCPDLFHSTNSTS